MAFIAGLLLMYLSEEDAFYMMVAILRGDRFNIHGLFSPGFPLLKEYFFQLRGLQKQLYPKLYNHFQEQSVVEEFYATQWFITLFLYSLPLELVLRIWDVFLFEGPKIIFRTAVYLWSRERKRLLKAEHLGATLTILKDSIEADVSKDARPMCGTVRVGVIVIFEYQRRVHGNLYWLYPTCFRGCVWQYILYLRSIEGYQSCT